MVIRYRNRQLDTLFQFVARISDPSNFTEFDLFSLGYPSSTANRICLLWCDTSSSENLRKKNANISAKKVQKHANSKTATNPTDNGEGMNPGACFLQTSENPQHEQNKIYTQIKSNKCIIGGSWYVYIILCIYNIYGANNVVNHGNLVKPTAKLQHLNTFDMYTTRFW